jgi:predicted O-methyltransferase YrrM
MDSIPAHRDALVKLLTELAGTADCLERERLSAAEIGVNTGATSEHLLENVPALWLTMVDSWRVPDHPTRKTPERIEANYRRALERTARFGSLRQVIRATSVEAAAEFPIDAFDLVFIDADHRYEAVRDDLAAWWPLVRSGGILCGHDYRSPKNDTGAWGVKRAVDEFVAANGLTMVEDQTVWIVRKA